MSRKRAKLDSAITVSATADPVDNVDPRAVEINRLHVEVWGHLRQGVEQAIRIGELLTEVKDALAHGEWLPWFEQNVRFSQSTASRYVRCYQNREMLNLSGTTNLTIEEAARLLCNGGPSAPGTIGNGTQHERSLKALDQVRLDKLAETSIRKFVSKLLGRVHEAQHIEITRLLARACERLAESLEREMNRGGSLDE